MLPGGLKSKYAHNHAPQGSFCLTSEGRKLLQRFIEFFSLGHMKGPVCLLIVIPLSVLVTDELILFLMYLPLFQVSIEKINKEDFI